MRAIDVLASAREKEGLLSAARFLGLAENALLRSYVLYCGDAPVAVVVGTAAEGTWHVHSIFCLKEPASLSIGTSVIHLALQDLIGNGFALADFGYGTPNQEFRSSHVLEERAHVMIYPRRSRYRLLFCAHGVCETVSEILVREIKQLRKKIAAWRQSSSRG
jgi:CelD/BcsL family acetyltransferase involved in cellulose biosynthesis